MPQPENCAPSTLRIMRVQGQTCTDLKNIAAREGVTLTHFLKPKLAEMIDGFEARIKADMRHCEPCQEIRVRGVSKKMKEKLKKIAQYYGVHPVELLRPALVDLAAGYPGHMKQPLLK